MTHSYVTELRQAGVAFDGYRELAQPVHDGQGMTRWPLIAATDQVLMAQRWKRQALAPIAPPSKVSHLPNARGAAPGVTSADWFLAEGTPPSPPSKTRAG